MTKENYNNGNCENPQSHKYSGENRVEEKTLKTVKERNFFFKLGWAIIGLALIAGVVLHFWHIPLISSPTGCLFFNLTHLYCPGCGGTRSAMALLLGHPVISLYFHPIVLYTAVLFGIYMLTNTIERLSKGRWKIGTHYHNWFAYVALVIVAGNCIVRNILLIFYHITI